MFKETFGRPFGKRGAETRTPDTVEDTARDEDLATRIAELQARIDNGTHTSDDARLLAKYREEQRMQH